MFKINLISISSFLFLWSCQSAFAPREPSSLKLSSLEKYYSNRVQIDFIEDKIKKLDYLKKKAHPDPADIFQLAELHEDERARLLSSQAQLKAENETLLSSVVQNSSDSLAIPSSTSFNYSDRWREHEDRLIIHNLNAFQLKNGILNHQFSMSIDNTKKYLLKLDNRVFTWKLKPVSSFDIYPTQGQPFLESRIRCNNDIKLNTYYGAKDIPNNTEYQFRWYDSQLVAEKLTVEVNNLNTECELYFKKPEDPDWSGVRLLSEQTQLARLQNPQSQGEVCFLPQADHVGEIENIFLAPNTKYISCPLKVSDFETLESSNESLSQKIKLLTGANLPMSYFVKPDPFFKLDFSKAPRLDAIIISYLVFRSDYSGQMLMQALRHHASRGVLIRIAVADVITLDKDRQMLLDFQAEYPNVKLLFYKYTSQGLGFVDWFSTLHRCNHIKVFLTYSRSESRHNQVIVGGRNIHDGFVFDAPPVKDKDPLVVNYNPGGDETWAQWIDFETRFGSTELVRQIMGQFFTVTHSDYPSVFIRNYTESIQLPQQINSNYFSLKDNEMLLRHLVSVPFKDDMSLESTYIKIFNSAQKSIKLSTPYFNLTRGLSDALLRAVERGVKIQLITRLDLDGDTADIVLSDVNKKAVNQMYDKIKVYEYTAAKKILHSKLVLIDDKLTIMGSINLNLRSFYHDLENANIIYSPSYNRKISALYESYKSEARPITEKQNASFWKKVIIKFAGTAL